MAVPVSQTVDVDVDFVVQVDLDPNATALPALPDVLWLRITAMDDMGRSVRAEKAVPVKATELASGMRKEMSADGVTTRNAGSVLFPREVLAAFHAAVDRVHQRSGRLRLCLMVTDHRLGAVPWELASVPERRDGATGPPQFLVRHHGVSVVRRVERAATAPRTAHPLDLRGTLLLGTALTVVGVFQTADGRCWSVPALDARDASSAETRAAAGHLGEQGSRDVRVLAEPLTRAELCRVLKQPVWCLFFAGHGRRDGIVLAGADGGAEFMAGTELAPLLVAAGVAVVVLAACATASPLPADNGPLDEDTAPWSPHLAEQLVRAGIPYVLGMDGLIGDRHAVTMTGRFFETLAWGGSVDRAVDGAREAMAYDWWQPVVYTSAEAPRYLTVPAPVSLSPETLRAFHVPPDWCGDRPQALPGSGRPARIDTLWCLDRGPLRGVLAEVCEDPESGPSGLAEQLNDVETGPLRLLTAHGGPLPRRHWFNVRAPWPEPQRDPGEFGIGLVRSEYLRPSLEDDPRGGRIGLILPFAASRDRPDEAVRYAKAIADCFPGAALIVHACARRAPRALEIATEIAAGLPRQRKDGTELGVSILMRVRPPLLTPASTIFEPVASHSLRSPLEMALALGPARRATGADPREDVWAAPAKEVVQRWQQEETAAVSHAVGNPWLPELVSLLGLADAVEIPPAFLRAILIEHARSRADPARSASLLLVCGDDDDLDVWLDTAEAAGRPVEPGALPPADWEAVLLAELRRAPTPRRVRAVAQRWEGRIRPAVLAVLDHLAMPGRDSLTPEQRSAVDLSFLEAVSDPAVAEAALHTGIGAGLGVADFPPGDPSPAVWALLSRRPLDAPTAQRLYRWSEALRRVLGYTLDPAEADPDVRDQVAVFHQVLRPWQWTPPRRPRAPAKS